MSLSSSCCGTKKKGPAIDAVTSKVLGIEAFLNQVQPRSEAAKPNWSRLQRAPFLGPETRRRELDRLSRLDDAISDALIEAMGRDLASLPTLQRLTRRLHAGEMLRDADFFELKRFLHHAVSILDIADGLDELPTADSPTPMLLAGLMDEIHPQQPRSARFHLADELHGALEESRSALREVRRAYKDRRRALESEIVGRYGGKFDLHGRFQPAGDEPVEARELRHEGSHYRLDDPELKSLKERLDELARHVGDHEDRQRRRLTGVVDDHRRLLFDIRERLIAFDERITRVELRRRIQGCWPQVVDGDSSPWFDVEAGQNPLLVEAIGADEVQPVDLRLQKLGTVVVGPNMGGKSALLKLVGLVQWCSQQALPVPARVCAVADVNHIVYIGSDEPERATLEDGLSSFGREVRRFVDHWEIDGPVLWLLDEPGRGTHPEEGSRLAEKIAQHLIERGDPVVMATHFPGLADLHGFARRQIAGLDVDDDTLEQAVKSARENGRSLTDILRKFMDFRVVDEPDAQIPRDARRVARALGLKLDGSDGP